MRSTAVLERDATSEPAEMPEPAPPEPGDELTPQPVAEPAASNVPDAASSVPDAPVLSDDAAPPLPGSYAQTVTDAMPPSLIADDNRTGRVIAILLCGLFCYTILAMGYALYWTLTNL